MTYFSLRKHADPEPEEEAGEEQPEEAEDEPEEKPPTKAYGPILTGLLGPGVWISTRLGAGWAWGIHAVAVWAVFFYSGWTAIGIPAVYVLAVLAFVPKEHLDRAAARIESRHAPSPQPAAAPAPGTEREAVRRLLLDLIGEAPGVHLRTVLAHLQEHGQWEGRKVAELRVHLEALGIPVDPKLKVDGTPTRGVRRADLQAPSPPTETSPSPAPSPPV